ncbi:predicted protein [Nematostella vectensis]|uniref:Uncharacterized protein n=1 Tax=Nematostella vectensis TaxID=45351 RepID=A7RW15_NEMVE|nr:predicted protein [Nematostella vectensis]|eukprot:XP_001636436.1 predicted protein [Nematostella vectensis]
MGRKTGNYRRNFARILAILFLIFQGGVLDFYLTNGEGTSWFAWLVTDVIVLVTWIVAMIISYRNLKKIHQERSTNFFNDELAFAYLAWFVYCLHLVPQIATLFRLKANELDEKTMVFGPNMLKMCLCITPVLFLFLIFAHHDARPYSKRKLYLEKICGSVTLDLFDSVEMLEYLFDKEHLNLGIEISILVFACVNIFLPSLALYELKHNKFHESGQVSPVSFKIIYVCGFLLFVNVPFLVIRLILWHSFNLDISVLLAKNALGVILGLIEIFEFCGDERPRRCKHCSGTFVKGKLKEHQERCQAEMIVMESAGPENGARPEDHDGKSGNAGMQTITSF